MRSFTFLPFTLGYAKKFYLLVNLPSVWLITPVTPLCVYIKGLRFQEFSKQIIDLNYVFFSPNVCTINTRV